MIIDKKANLSLYRGLSPLMDKALEFLEGLDTPSLAPGRTEIDGDKLYLLCQKYDTKPIRGAIWENHRRLTVDDIEIFANIFREMGLFVTVGG